jgi:hypothetical protein
VKLITSTYTDNVKGEKLHWKPKTAVPAWTYFGLKSLQLIEKSI